MRAHGAPLPLWRVNAGLSLEVLLLNVESIMGIQGLMKLIGDYAPQAVKENDIKTYFGKLSILFC